MKQRLNIIRTGVILSLLSFIYACTPLKMNVKGSNSEGKTTHGISSYNSQKSAVSEY